MSDSKLKLLKGPFCQDPVEAYGVCSGYFRLRDSTCYRKYTYTLSLKDSIKMKLTKTVTNF